MDTLTKPKSTQTLLKYLSQQRENKQFMDSLEIAFTFCAIAFFIFVAIKPTVVTIVGVNSDNKAKQKAIKDMKKKINNIVIAQTNYAKLTETKVDGSLTDIEMIEKTLPSSAMYGEVADQIEGTALKTGASVSNIGFNLNQDEKNKSAYKFFGVNIAGEDSYSNAVNFIGKFTSNRRIMEIDSISISKPSELNMQFSNKVLDPNSIIFNVSTKFAVINKNVKK